MKWTTCVCILYIFCFLVHLHIHLHRSDTKPVVNWQSTPLIQLANPNLPVPAVTFPLPLFFYFPSFCLLSVEHQGGSIPTLLPDLHPSVSFSSNVNAQLFNYILTKHALC